MQSELIHDLDTRLDNQEQLIHVETDFDNLDKPDRCSDWATVFVVVTSEKRVIVPFDKICIFDLMPAAPGVHIYLSTHPETSKSNRRINKHFMRHPESLELRYGIPNPEKPIKLGEESIPVKIIRFNKPLLIGLTYTKDAYHSSSVNVAFQCMKNGISITECD